MTLDRCDQARPSLSAEEMAELIAHAPPGPWSDGWAGWDCVRDAHLFLMERAIETCPPFPEGRYEGRGIVVSVNAKPGMSSGKHLSHGYFPGAWVLVRELRRLGCTLPVTFAHLGHAEWDPTLTRLVAPLGVEVLDLRACEEVDPHRPRILAGWESKVYSILQSRYEEVLYLDADNIAILDPTFLFDSSQYRYYGSVFWPDVPPFDRAEWLPEVVWKNCGMSFRDEVDFESGQILVDKKRCWRELQLAAWMNYHSDYFYRFIFGDKSTFHLAWARLGTNWAIPQRGAGGNQASLYQHDFSGKVLFQHCTRNKPSLCGYPSPGHLMRPGECNAHLDELRSLWHGKLWHNADPTDEERRLIAFLEGEVYAYEREGMGSRPFRLLPDGRVGRGLARCEVSWDLFVLDSEPHLVIRSLDDEPTAILTRDGDGCWAGRWLSHERNRCWLRPEQVQGKEEAA